MSKREITADATVCVTGAMGGVGRHVVRALVDAGCDVIAIDLRAPESDPTFALICDPETFTFHQLDLKTDSIDSILKDCDAIIHAAGFLGLSETYDELRPDNTDLVEDLYTAAEDNGVKHFIHFSCGTIYKPGRGVRDENHPLHAQNDFERTKIESEQAFPDVAKTTRWTILRPAWIYGPHTKSMSAGLVTLPPILRIFTPYLPGLTGGTRSNWCHVEDAASAAMVVLGNPMAYEAVFNVSDDTPLGFGETITAIAEAYPLEIGPLVRFPSPTLLTAFSPVVDRDYVASTLRIALRQLWKRIVAKHELDTPLRPKVDRNALFYAAEDTVLDNAELKKLGWSPKWRSFPEGIVETVQWYQDQNWAPRYDSESSEKIRSEVTHYGFSVDHPWIGTVSNSENNDEQTVRAEIKLTLPRVVRGDFSGQIDGQIWIDRLAEGERFEGTVDAKLFSERSFKYQLGFNGKDGESYRIVATATFSPLRPIQSFSEWNGHLINAAGEHVGELALDIELADQVVNILTSFSRIS